jgi:hypothetical protein
MDQGNQGNSDGPPGAPGTPELISSPPVPAGDGGDAYPHLFENRRLIVRRALLATAVGGIIPIPVLDEYFAGRVRAGMLMKIAERRRVDLAGSSAELLGDPREGTTVRNATLTAATLLALKLAWRKFFALLALGRRAEEMATTYQLGILFDHYCTKLHVGAGIDRVQAVELRGAIHAALSESERAALVTAFRDGSRVLGRSALEAPTWANERLQRAARRWAETGGQSADPLDEGAEAGAEADRWIDRAARAVEERLGRLGHSYVASLVRTFERHFRQLEARRAAQAGAANPAPK